MKLNKTQGGYRPGSGRPKLKESEKKEKTKTIRIPLSMVDDVLQQIKDRPRKVKPTKK